MLNFYFTEVPIIFQLSAIWQDESNKCKIEERNKSGKIKDKKIKKKKTEKKGKPKSTLNIKKVRVIKKATEDKNYYLENNTMWSGSCLCKENEILKNWSKFSD